MNNIGMLVILFIAAVLEAGGDALVRTGLHSPTAAKRFLMLVVGGLVLFAYGVVVNTPKWDFGKLLGIYVAFFFIVAQLISWAAFHQPPTRPICVGGLLIIVGGLIISFWQPH